MIKFKKDTYFVILLSALLLMLGVLRVPNVYFQGYLQLLFVGIIVLGFAYIIYKNTKNIWISFFLFCSFISYINPRSSVYTTSQGDKTFLYIILSIIWYFMITTNLNKSNINIILNIFCFIAIINVIYIVLQYYKLDFIRHFKSNNLWISGLATNSNEISALLAILISACLRKKWIIFLPMILIGLIFPKSLTGIVTTGCIILIYLFINNKIKLSFIYLLMCIAGIYLFYRYIDKNKGGIRVRYKLWEEIIEIFKNYYLFGYKLGEFKLLSKWDSNIFTIDGYTWWRTTHNEYIHGIFEMGIMVIPILIGYICYLIKKLIMGLNKVIFCGVLSSCICACFTDVFHKPILAGFALTWIALADIDTN
ncbi:MAG: hypothetical protein ACFFG0_09510 [Candidatus Thorarchaeota archaeon]